MGVARLLRFASLVLAICIALQGQLRAADLVDLDDQDTITAQTSDEFITTTIAGGMEPPRLGGVIPTFPSTLGSGRATVVELFRPPQTPT